ncbi:MAG: hypothetical protein KF696_01385 [Planctomycetes bacterium]|nr:hypothetical protein [Planctomycetota bacterium]MCW8134407.1 hypothetical protein [Planctomycetota bacterium]
MAGARQRLKTTKSVTVRYHQAAIALLPYHARHRNAVISHAKFVVVVAANKLRIQLIQP